MAEVALRVTQTSAAGFKRYLRQAIAAAIVAVRPSLLYYAADPIERRGITAKTVGDLIEISRPADRQAIRLSRAHALYLPLFIDSFRYFFDAVEPVATATKHGHYDVVDYSKPRHHRVKGFDDFPVLFPSMTEPYVTTEQYLEFAELREGQIVLDIGAYSALATIAFSKAVGQQGRVIAVEPDPLSVAAAQVNIEAHQTANALDNIVLIAAAVAPESGMLHFSSEGAMGAAPASIIGRRRGNVLNVEAITLRNVVDRFGLSRIDFLKIDIEGAELDLIVRSGDFLKTYRPRMIIEPHFIDGELTAKPIMSFLESIGYQCRIIEQTGLRSLPLVTAVPQV